MATFIPNQACGKIATRPSLLNVGSASSCSSGAAGYENSNHLLEKRNPISRQSHYLRYSLFLLLDIIVSERKEKACVFCHTCQTNWFSRETRVCHRPLLISRDHNSPEFLLLYDRFSHLFFLFITTTCFWHCRATIQLHQMFPGMHVTQNRAART